MHYFLPLRLSGWRSAALSFLYKACKYSQNEIGRRGNLGYLGYGLQVVSEPSSDLQPTLHPLRVRTMRGPVPKAVRFLGWSLPDGWQTALFKLNRNENIYDSRLQHGSLRLCTVNKRHVFCL